jgi:translocation protein SEC63
MLLTSPRYACSLLFVSRGRQGSCSWLAQNRKPTWSIFIGDHKLNRVFVAPHKFTDMGPNQVRTVRMSFQAPPGPGLYTFQVYVMSDSFVGTDAQKDLRVRLSSFRLSRLGTTDSFSPLAFEQMKVEPPTMGGELVGEEDDISEPDEDTIAGQMALMKGQAVRRAPRDSDEDDDTSGTEEEEEEEETSDSDSD